EAVDTLRGKGPQDLTELCLALGSHMLVAGGKARDAKEARQMLNTLLQNGKAIDKFREFIIRQGGDASFLDDHKLLPKATHIVEVRADKEGFVSRMDAEKLGRAAMKLGAGRETKDSIIDLAAGIMLRVKTGDRVKPG